MFIYLPERQHYINAASTRVLHAGITESRPFCLLVRFSTNAVSLLEQYPLVKPSEISAYLPTASGGRVHIPLLYCLGTPSCLQGIASQVLRSPRGLYSLVKRSNVYLCSADAIALTPVLTRVNAVNSSTWYTWLD